MSEDLIKDVVDSCVRLHVYAEGDGLTSAEIVEGYESIIRECVGTVLDDIENRAEANMMKTHKLEGMHYAALKDIRDELGIERRLTPDEKGQR